MPRQLLIFRFLVGLGIALAVAACGPRGKEPPATLSETTATAVVVTPAVAVDRPLEIEALGTARALDAVEITSRVTNVVEAIEFEDGQLVRTGEVLVRLDDEETEADLALAEAALAESRSQYRRSKELYESRTVSESQMVALEARLRADEARVQAARARLERTVIKAPFSGHVGLRRVSVGSLVTPGTVVTTLDDDSTVQLDVAVPERFLSLVETGMRVDARAAAYPDAVFVGAVTALDSRVDTVTRTMTIRATVPNPEGLIRSGMFVSVRLVGQPRRVTVVPEESLVPEGEHQYVFIVADDKAHRREVVLGQRRPGEVEILEGIVTGDLVVVEGTQKIADGVPVRVTESPVRMVRQQ